MFARLPGVGESNREKFRAQTGDLGHAPHPIFLTRLF
jgi:hypothetical protein